MMRKFDRGGTGVQCTAKIYLLNFPGDSWRLCGKNLMQVSLKLMWRGKHPNCLPNSRAIPLPYLSDPVLLRQKDFLLPYKYFFIRSNTIILYSQFILSGQIRVSSFP